MKVNTELEEENFIYIVKVFYFVKLQTNIQLCVAQLYFTSIHVLKKCNYFLFIYFSKLHKRLTKLGGEKY